MAKKAITVGMALPHMGESVREEIIKPLELTIDRASKLLGVSRKTLSSLVNERSSLSPEMAIRLEKAFGLFSAEMLMRMQANYDIAQALSDADRIEVERYRPVARR